MKKSAKIWLITASSLSLVGLIIFIAAMSAVKWDFTKLSNEKYETNSYEIENEYQSISVNASTAVITVALSDTQKTSVVCYEEEKSRHSVSVVDDSLVIKVVNTKKWYDNIGINFETPKITIYLPLKEYSSLKIKASTSNVYLPKEIKFENIDVSLSTGNVKNLASATSLIKIKTSTGYINVSDISAGALSLTTSTGAIQLSNVSTDGDVTMHVSTGRVKIENLKCKSLTSVGDTGRISLKNTVAAESLSIKRDTGNVSLTSCDAAKILIKTDTGDVKGSLRSEKVFIVRTDTGSINVPQTTSGGICEITTDTGDIKITVE